MKKVVLSLFMVVMLAGCSHKAKFPKNHPPVPDAIIPKTCIADLQVSTTMCSPTKDSTLFMCQDVLVKAYCIKALEKPQVLGSSKADISGSTTQPH